GKSRLPPVAAAIADRGGLSDRRPGASARPLTRLSARPSARPSVRLVSASTPSIRTDGCLLGGKPDRDGKARGNVASACANDIRANARDQRVHPARSDPWLDSQPDRVSRPNACVEPRTSTGRRGTARAIRPGEVNARVKPPAVVI